MKTIWTATYDNNEIKVVNTWFNGESLYVNNELQDKTFGFGFTKLRGHIINANGEKVLIKANLGGWFSEV